MGKRIGLHGAGFLPISSLGVTVKGAGLAYCTFNDPNGTSLNAYSWANASDVRPGVAQWVENMGNLDIQGGRANAISLSSNQALGILDCGAADGTLSIIANFLNVGASTYVRGLAYRMDLLGNGWIAGFRGLDNTWGIYQMASWLTTARATIPLLAPFGVDCTIQVVLSGNNMIATVNGANSVNFSSAIGVAATRHGFRLRAIGEVFDDFWMM